MRACPSHRTYGLDCDRYDDLLESANHRCQLCGDDYALVIDHDHGVGAWAVRGILCATCNSFLHYKTGAKVRRYLANPWHAANPDHPVVPTPRATTELAISLYATLDELTHAFGAATREGQRRIRAEAEQIGIALLREKEGATTIVARAPFSDAHFRKVARQAGVAPARNGTRINYRAR